ncbi:helix-turn-helix transcriptional regulator [Dactylosporangium sp. NPDC005572]|uniref:helix-turn-helix domain-containing protein n=1 Tax=Dactylosporangium sp. NPDC005572 TaxID=3156889 RepID=UPI0033BCCF04
MTPDQQPDADRERAGDPIIDQLAAARTDQGTSYRQLQAMSGLSSGFVCEVEQGKHSVSLQHLRRWAKALGYEVTLTPLAAMLVVVPEDTTCAVCGDDIWATEQARPIPAGLRCLVCDVQDRQPAGQPEDGA